jgi:hypothetical protein
LNTSAFGWLDYDDGERRRMMEVINLFREKGTLDELGIGTIRDTHAEHFFPGTSTIQSRARYFLFIPWLYLQLERERVPRPCLSNRPVIRAWRVGRISNYGTLGDHRPEWRRLQPSTVLMRWNRGHSATARKAASTLADRPGRV